MICWRGWAFLGLLVLTASSARAASADEALKALREAKRLAQWTSAQVMLEALGPEEEPVLRDYIKDTSQDGRKRFMALKAICKHLSPDRAADYFVRNRCRLAILRIQMAGKPEAYRIKLLREALLEDGYFDVRGWAGKRLGEMGGEAAGIVLAEVAKNPKAPGQAMAWSGLLLGVEKGHWTKEDIQRWLKE